MDRSTRALPRLEEFAPDWAHALRCELEAPYMAQLAHRLAQEMQTEGDELGFYPPPRLVFNAFAQTPLKDVRVVILGQDPYHKPGLAHGLSFSVPSGSQIPASLRNIFRELRDDLGGALRERADLTDWAKQGVLLLNAVLTVRPRQAASHRGIGWEAFTDAVVRTLVAREQGIVFVLWGAAARAKCPLLTPRDEVLATPHPSPLSAYRGFFGSRPFSQVNARLERRGSDPVEWTVSSAGHH